MPSSRRELIAAAFALGATAAFAGAPRLRRTFWKECRERFPEGVASGDPHADSVIVWTRYEAQEIGQSVAVTMELAEDVHFDLIVARKLTTVSDQSDGTCRVLVGGLKASTTYWYRFMTPDGEGSRVGRTRTAPHDADARAVKFAFVSCQNINLGPLTAWRRMVFDDEHAAEAEQLEFILHLGDFIYDTVWMPEDRPQGYYDRKPRKIVDFPQGEKHEDFHVPVTLADYRALYHAYLRDPDLQDVRARWPFVAIWDNGEFSDKGWQGLQRFGSVTKPAQTRKVAANQAWFEFMPARVRTLDGSLAAFAAPKVEDAPIRQFDRAGLGQEKNNLAAIDSLMGYRALRWGRHVDLILTDQRSYRSEDYTAAPEAAALSSAHFPQMVPFETLQKIDAGETWPGGAPDKLQFADKQASNFRKSNQPRTLLGAEQKAWFFERLAASTATWKVWANTVATFDMRADPQNLPAGLTVPWPGEGYAGFARTDHSTTYAERAEIYRFVQQHRIAGFATLSGDRHSFWAGYSAAQLPPGNFRPVGINFVVGSISSPGMVEAFEYTLPKAHPLRALYLIDRPAEPHPEASMNLLFRHGVRTCLDYAKDHDLAKARLLTNPENAPHVEFVDMGGHGYAVVRAALNRMDVEFVCIPRPLTDNALPDGGPVRYRVVHSAQLWKPGDTPKLSCTHVEGDPELSA
jgi:alkaline phosphatase D